MKKILTLISLTAFIIFAVCSKDKDSPTEPTSEEAPQLQLHTISVPTKMLQSSDPHAQAVVYYTQVANIFAASMSGFVFPPDGVGPTTRQGNLWQYNWSQDALEILLRVTENDNNFSWVTEFDGKDGEYDYYNWVAYRATQTKDGKSGTFTAYMPNTTIALGEYSWFMDETGTLHFEADVSALQEGRTFKGVINTDQSGTLEVYEMVNGESVLLEKYQWDATGAGQWWTYENGEVKDSGSWN